MLEAVKVRLDPSPVQELALSSHAGASRFAYNAALGHVTAALAQRDAEKTYGVPEEDLTPVPWSYYGLRKWWNTQKPVLAPWWGENSKEAYAHGLESLARALDAFSKSRTGKRKGARVGFPKFKSRHRARPAFAYTTGSFGIADNVGVRLPRIGRVHVMENIRDRVGDGRILRVTITRRAGRWYAAFTVERDNRRRRRRPVPGSVVGVDLGVATLAVLDTGESFPNPRHHSSALTRLAKANRAYARTQKGSANRRRAAERLARAHARVANQRADAIHKLTTGLSDRFQTIVLEDLNVAGMLTNHALARHIADASFGEIRRQLEYKTERNGGSIVTADRFFPSSKTCSNCGAVKAKLALSERTYACEHCGLTIDRDVNAAINLRTLAGSGPERQNGGGATQKTHQWAARQRDRNQHRHAVMDRQPETAASPTV